MPTHTATHHALLDVEQVLDGAHDIVRLGEHEVLDVLGIRRGQVSTRNTNCGGVKIIKGRSLIRKERQQRDEKEKKREARERREVREGYTNKIKGEKQELLRILKKRKETEHTIHT